MRVGIAGAGAIAMGYAALLLDRGHCPMIWSPSGKRTASLVAGVTLKVSGAINGEYRPDIAPSANVLAENEIIVIALPANGYRLVIDQLVPVLGSEHTVIFSGHLSFGALYLAKRLAERNVEISIGVWNTTVLTSKASDPTTIKVGASVVAARNARSF